MSVAATVDNLRQHGCLLHQQNTNLVFVYALWDTRLAGVTGSTNLLGVAYNGVGFTNRQMRLFWVC